MAAQKQRKVLLAFFDFSIKTVKLKRIKETKCQGGVALQDCGRSTNSLF